MQYKEVTMPAKRGARNMKSEKKVTEHFVETFDGTKLYYNSVGEGFPLICSDGIACDMYAWKYIVEQFSPRCRIIRWNYRGHGKSEKPADMNRLSIEDCADDLAVVMKDAGIKSAVHLGHSMGVQVIFEFYRRHEEKVRALVPVTGSYGNPLHTFHDSKIFNRLFPLVYDLVTTRHEDIMPIWKKIVPTNLAFKIATMSEINGKLVKQCDFMPYLDHISQLDINLFVRMLKFANEHTARDVLPTIKVPVLIFGAEHDNFTPVWLSKEMQSLIPGSEFQFLPLGTHTAPIEHQDLIELRLDKFLRDHFPGEYGTKGSKTKAKSSTPKKASVKKTALKKGTSEIHEQAEQMVEASPRQPQVEG